MGFREWILGFNPDDVKALKSKIQELEDSIIVSSSYYKTAMV